jgi:hypothetical protein
MKTYALFYDEYGRNPCGDRSIIQIDGRLNHVNACALAYTECKNRGFHVFHVVKANSILDIPARFDQY